MAEPEYGDLLAILGEVNMDGYCGYHYTRWENEVATPRLRELGYEVVGWFMGERDSFGPLSRVVHVSKDGELSKLVYG